MSIRKNQSNEPGLVKMVLLVAMICVIAVKAAASIIRTTVKTVDGVRTAR